MATVIRPKISEKNRYWISKHRYYELKHFCLQYPEWKQAYQNLDGMPAQAQAVHDRVNSGVISDPTERAAESRLYFRHRMDLVENAAKEAAEDLADLLIESITNEISYEKLSARGLVPCCKDVWYAAYRRFFWLLDQARN